jgi:hypothetical protein
MPMVEAMASSLVQVNVRSWKTFREAVDIARKPPSCWTCAGHEVQYQYCFGTGEEHEGEESWHDV